MGPLIGAGWVHASSAVAHKRSPEFKESPTLKELGYDLVAEGFQGVGGPKGLPEPIRRKLEDAFTQALKEPTYNELLKKLTFMEDYKNSKDFSKFVAESFKQHGELIREVGLDVLKQ